MNLLLYLAAAAAATTLTSLCQAARIPRGVAGFPHFHSVHHGYGATSYQNVQIENYGSVPVPTEDHLQYHNYPQEQPFIIHVIGGVHHDEHDHDTSAIHDGVPIINQHQHLEQLIIVEKDHHQLPLVAHDNHEDSHHFITLDEVPNVNNEIHHGELHSVPDFSFYHNNVAYFISHYRR